MLQVSTSPSPAAQIISSEPSIRLYPTSMARFGQNPYGENLYRIVFAASRMYQVGGRWADGAAEYRWRPLYAHITEPWVLEVWMPPERFAGTPTQWDLKYRDPVSGLLLIGPYPSRGEYQHCHTFTCAVEDSNLGKLIRWIEEGDKRSWQDNLDASRQAYQEDTEARRSQMDAICRNAMPAFLDSAFSGGKVSRGSKSRPIVRTAEEVGLPTGNNKFINLRKRN